MRINNNIMAINSHRQYGINNSALGKNVERLSSGFRVNRAGDDAAGLAISEKMRAQIRGLNMASKNSQDAISLVQTAEGGMQTLHDILQRMRELAIQSASDTNLERVDREALQLEVEQLIEEIDQIADTTEFNNMKLLDGSFAGEGTEIHVPEEDPPDPAITPRDLVIQAGANQGQQMLISIAQMSSGGLGLEGVRVALLTPTTELEDDEIHPAREAIETINRAINSVSMARAKLGAFQNRLEFKIQNLNYQAENISAAESRIRDADMAATMTQFTRNNILFQASTAMLAQANALPQGVLQLLG
jgi:flagellin